jgi:predicted alpha/beta superfamily hydrolase
MKKIVLVLTLFFPSISFSQTNDAVLKLGNRDSIYSETLDEMRYYWVHLPSSYYDKSIQPMKYPVLYILDGNIHFHSITGMTEILGSGVNGTHVIPEMIVVAILNTDRTRDLTPTSSKKGFDGKDADWIVNSGGGDDFLRFLQEELIPAVESDYRTFPYRTFIGHSFGGLAAINALISRPHLFNAYVLIDPSLWWDEKIILKRTAAFLESPDLKGRSLFIGQANPFVADDPRGNAPVDAFESTKELKTMLEKHNNTGLNWRYKYYDQDNHGSVAFIAEYEALRFIFEDYFAPFDKIRNASDLKKHYQRFSEKIAITFKPPEKVVNELAGIAMFFKRYNLVNEYYQMNIDLYPNSPGAYRKMANLWLTQGDQKKAIEYLQKCLQVDPANQKVKDQIANLTKTMGE